MAIKLDYRVLFLCILYGYNRYIKVLYLFYLVKKSKLVRNQYQKWHTENKKYSSQNRSFDIFVIFICFCFGFPNLLLSLPNGFSCFTGSTLPVKSVVSIFQIRLAHGSQASEQLMWAFYARFLSSSRSKCLGSEIKFGESTSLINSSQLWSSRSTSPIEPHPNWSWLKKFLAVEKWPQWSNFVYIRQSLAVNIERHVAAHIHM